MHEPGAKFLFTLTMKISTITVGYLQKRYVKRFTEKNHFT